MTKIRKIFAVAEKKIEINEFVAKLFDATGSQEERQDHSTGENQEHQHQVPARSLDNSVDAASNRVQKLVRSACIFCAAACK